MSNNKKESKLFRFFNYHRDNQIDAREEDTTPTLGRYFKVLGRRFWKLISLNIMMLPMILPILVPLKLPKISITPQLWKLNLPQQKHLRQFAPLLPKF